MLRTFSGRSPCRLATPTRSAGDGAGGIKGVESNRNSTTDPFCAFRKSLSANRWGCHDGEGADTRLAEPDTGDGSASRGRRVGKGAGVAPEVPGRRGDAR